MFLSRDSVASLCNNVSGNTYGDAFEFWAALIALDKMSNVVLIKFCRLVHNCLESISAAIAAIPNSVVWVMFCKTLISEVKAE